MKDYFSMSPQDLAVEWQMCRNDNPERAKKMEETADQFYAKDTYSYHLHLLAQAHHEGWIE
jgi:hypothetical protein